MPYRGDESYSDWGASDLREQRTAMKMTKRALAEELGVSERQYAYYESGHTKIDKTLQCAVRWIMSGKDDSEDTKPQGTLTDFEKDRITRLMNVMQNHPHDDLDERTQKILQQSSQEMVLLLSKVSN